MVHDPASANYQISQMPAERREMVTVWDDILMAFDQAVDKRSAELELRDRYGHRVSFSTGTLYRKLARWREHGVAGILPERVRRRVMEDETPLKPEFRDFWLGICAQNQRKTAPAWRHLIEDHLIAGKMIPGYGTDWRGIWKHEHPKFSIPESCPYSRKGNCLPKGWSQRNLHRHAMNAYQRSATRQGTAAAREFLPMIPSTRVGLPFGRVYLIDDVEWDVKVMFLGNREPQGVVELGALELLTGHYCTWGAKPVRERINGSREKLSEELNRFLIAHICCGVGFSIEGCMIVGEHGTAKLPQGLQDTLDRLSGGMIKFVAGGIMNKPIAKGLPLGLRRGNFRIKAALESRWNLFKNEMAQLPGQKGADPEHAPEDLESKRQHAVSVIKAAFALGETRPDLLDNFRTSFVPYFQMLEFASLLYQRIEDRPDHKLEGWEDCGFIRPEWRVPGNPLWQPLAALSEMVPVDADAIRGVIERNPESCMRQRAMSPREAFVYCQERDKDRLVRLPDYAVPDILGPNLADHVEVEKTATMNIPNRYLPNRSTQVGAVVRHPDGMISNLSRGSKVMVWLSPYDNKKAFVATQEGIYLGIAPVIVPGTKIDMDALARNVAIAKTIESAELKTLAPIAEARLRDQLAMREHNVKTLTGKTVAELVQGEAATTVISRETDDIIEDLYGHKG